MCSLEEGLAAPNERTGWRMGLWHTKTGGKLQKDHSKRRGKFLIRLKYENSNTAKTQCKIIAPPGTSNGLAIRLLEQRNESVVV